MATSKHSELERKFAAGDVSEMSFRLWCEQHHPINRKSANFPDVYYSRGTSVIRHRKSGHAGELTVKQRKSMTDTTDRVEIDLKFAPSVTHDDVTAFVLATGWEEVLVLHKHFSETYWFKHGGAEISVSLYEVEDIKTKRVKRMLEVEVEKGSAVTEEEALNLLTIWCDILAEDMELGEPLQDSLYEIFSGKKYEMAVSAYLPYLPSSVPEDMCLHMIKCWGKCTAPR